EKSGMDAVLGASLLIGAAAGAVCPKAGGAAAAASATHKRKSRRPFMASSPFFGSPDSCAFRTRYQRRPQGRAFEWETSGARVSVGYAHQGVNARLRGLWAAK